MAKVIIMVHDTDEYSERLANEFYNFKGELDEFVEHVRRCYPQALCEPEEERVQGMVDEQSDRYILTNEQHNMGETMRIYEKQMSRTWKERIFALFDAINRSGVDNSQWGLCEDVEDTHRMFGTVAVLPMPGKWLYVYTDEDGDNPLGRWSERLPEPDYEMALERDGDEPMINQSIVFYKLED